MKIKDIRSAIWQYFEEHGRYDKDGRLTVYFTIRNQKHFWRKIAGRQRGYGDGRPVGISWCKPKTRWEKIKKWLKRKLK